MPHKTKISGVEKIATIEKYLRGEDSINHLAMLLEVHPESVKQWPRVEKPDTDLPCPSIILVVLQHQVFPNHGFRL
ncbi:hypothetical protein SDC9_79955 [bioreactor metagenome]|uniref:Uncharacterized protein n=1 Tax=bioreactor metagenome TaxID=1076179 RepID=A0A644Z054_9ZZZZ